MNITDINTSPTEGQKIAGNYRKGHARVHGLDITIENPAGSYRRGIGADGKPWRSRLPNHYGYIRGTAGSDGDHVDVYLGHHLKAPKVFVIDQGNLKTGEHDEHKCFLGFASAKQARSSYVRAFSDGKGERRIRRMVEMDVPQFKAWLKGGGGRVPLKRAEGGRIMLAPQDAHSTPLSLSDEARYQLWKMQNAPLDSGEDYDLRGAFMAGESPGPDGHWTDRFKKPNHETFSDESQYAVGPERARAGFWSGPNHDVFVPPQPFAAGGGVESGPPPFEMTSDAPPFEATQPVEDAGKLDAALRGARAGATFNLGDELAGARAAAPGWVPEAVGPIPTKTIAGAGRAAVANMTNLDPEGLAAYEKARDVERKADKSAEANHPYIYGGAEIAGSIPAMAALPEAGIAARIPQAAGKVSKFAGKTLDAMTTAAQYGGLSGAGEGDDLGDRAMKGASGIVSGILGGGIASILGSGANWAVQKYGAPVVNTIRGWMNPDGEAARRLASALKIDQDLIQAGKATGMTPQQWAAARQAGEPVTLADLGSANTQALLRSAANTNPEGRALMEKVIEDRFLSQNERVAETVRRALPGGSGNARKTADQLVAEYDAARVPLYRKAYQDGDKEIISPTIERLMGSPTFEAAMKKAITSGKDAAVSMEGMGAFNPGIRLDPGGAFVYTRTKPGGGPVYPNLQYWDAVKRQLDDVADTAFNSGAKRQGEVVSNMAKLLRTELDAQVPSYKAARGVAEEFFGERNALEAGRKLAGKKADPEEVKAILRKMKPDERALFREGYASDLAERVIGNLKDTVNITKGQGMFQSPNERKLAAAIFGPGGMAMLQARMHVERVMDGARQAMGNSTTARQLIEAGLAGGALAGYASGWDPGSMMAGATGLAGARWGKGAHVGLSQVADSAKHFIGKVDAKTAKRVAELLTSDDPRLLREGYRMAAKSQKIMNGLKRIGDRLALAGQTAGREPTTQGVRMLQGPMGARADDEQQRP